MQTAELFPHPTTPCPAVHRITVYPSRDESGLLILDYLLEGDIAALLIPAAAESHRADELWRHTCFEAFLSAKGVDGYYEFNFAPSTEWAIYRFTTYREGMANAEPAAPPSFAVEHDERQLRLTARVDLRGLLPDAAARLRLGLTAVIESRDGGIAYWALRHPPGQPDFHHSDGFALEPAPPAA
jgi:hypothetical protein